MNLQSVGQWLKSFIRYNKIANRWRGCFEFFIGGCTQSSQIGVNWVEKKKAQVS